MGMRAAACRAPQILATGRHITATFADLPTLFERDPGRRRMPEQQEKVSPPPPPGSLGLCASRSAPSRAQPMTGGCRRSMAPMSTLCSARLATSRR